MRRSIVLLLGLIMIFGLTACGNNETVEETQTTTEVNEEVATEESESTEETAETTEGEVLRVGLEAAYPPFNWTQQDDSNGAIPIEGSPDFANGYDVQMARKIGDALGREVVAVKTEWDGLVPALTSGKIDIIIAGMSPTAERAQVIDFTEPYYESDLVLVVNAIGDYANATTLADFEGANVVAQLNTSHDRAIDQIEGVNHLTPMSDFPTMRVAVQSGKADAYVGERPEGLAAERAGVDLKMIELTDGFEMDPEDSQVAIGLVKGYEGLAEINEILAGISEDERQEIMDQMSQISGE